MSDHFVADKLAWLDGVSHDRRIGLLGFRVAYAIASHVNRKTRLAWPTYQTLANEVGVKPRSVMRAIEELEGAGHLSISRARGHHPNRYRWILGAEPELPFGEETVTEESPLGPQETVTPESPLDDANGDTGVTEQQPQTVTLQATNSGSTVNKQCHQSHPEHFEEHSEEHIEGRNGQKRGSGRRKARAAIPAEIEISDKQLADAADQGWDSVRARAEFDRFADWHRANGKLLADVNAAWRNWVRGGVDRDRKQHRSNSAGPRSAAEGIAAFVRRDGQ